MTNAKDLVLGEWEYRSITTFGVGNGLLSGDVVIDEHRSVTYCC